MALENKIFSIKNNESSGRVEVCFLGIKLKFFNKKLARSINYSETLKKVANKYKNNQKIRVGFLVSDNSKWNADDLYEVFEKSEEFEPVILLTITTDAHKGKDKTKNNLEENLNFFANKRVVCAYDNINKKYIDLSEFDIDVIFYQQPWYINDNQNIDEVSEYALCCYFDYGAGLIECKLSNLIFHEKLFHYYIPNKLIRRATEKFKMTSNDNLKEIGFPKLDVYRDLEINKNKTNTIIYAPHFAYKRNSMLPIGTFNWSGEKMLEIAKKHSEIHWIFKPHPNLKNTLIKDRKYGEKFASEYYKKWEEIGEIYDKGNYFEMFANSDMLITDCNSFLLEYMPTTKPIIRLSNKKSKVKISEFGNYILNGIYSVYNFKEFDELFNTLRDNKSDNLLATRQELRKKLVEDSEISSYRIYKTLLNSIKESEN